MNPTITHHPKSLKIFFSTEMWERYGFYVVQSLLALYLSLHFRWNDQDVYKLVGSFTALTYLTPFAGGWIADKLIGQKRSVLLGALILFLSYLVLVFSNHHTLLIAALAGVATGTGLFKSNISSLLGNQYPKESLKRENGFTIFYMGITLGIILGTTLPSQLNQYFGWSAAFISGAMGMVFAFFIFLFGIKRHQINDYQAMAYCLSDHMKAILILAILWGLSWIILNNPTLADLAFISIVILSVSYLIFVARQEAPLQRKQTMIIGLLCLISLLFWAFYFQMFLALTLFLVRVAKSTLLGLPFPPPYYVAAESIGMLIFGYLLTFRKNTRTFSISIHAIRTSNKFLLAMLMLFFAYASITLIATWHPMPVLLSPIYFLPAYLMISVAELLLSPVGLATITLLSCPKKASTMIGIFFISLGLGAYLSGKLSMITALAPEHLTTLQIKLHYAHSFSILLLILLGCVILSTIIHWIIRRFAKTAQFHALSNT